MKIHRFYVPSLSKNGDAISIRDQALLEQWHRVLRLKIGETLVVFSGDGQETTALIEQLDANEARLKIVESREVTTESERNITLYASILKRENFELLVQKATEVGVARIIPMITARTVKLGLKTERLEKIIIEAAEQSGRGRIPTLGATMSFEEVLEDSKKNEMNYLCDVSGESLSAQKIKAKNLGIFIGPEGGWQDEEIKKAKETGCTIVSLGKLTLRAETAGIVASYLFSQ